MLHSEAGRGGLLVLPDPVEKGVLPRLPGGALRLGGQLPQPGLAAPGVGGRHPGPDRLVLVRAGEEAFDN